MKITTLNLIKTQFYPYGNWLMVTGIYLSSLQQFFWFNIVQDAKVLIKCTDVKLMNKFPLNFLKV